MIKRKKVNETFRTKKLTKLNYIRLPDVPNPVVTINVHGWLLEPAALDASQMIVSLGTPFLMLYRR